MDHYSHTQKSPLCLLLYCTAIALIVGAWTTQEEPAVAFTLGIAGFVTFLLGTAFHYLTVMDKSDRLAIWFGPLPLFRRNVQYADIERVEVGRTLIIEGWGIHYSIRGGWVWNIWGRDCVALHLKNDRVLRIGTDEAENLVEFLRSKVLV